MFLADECCSLPGQRMSACTCPGEDHAGPDVTVGRGVPEIDIIEVCPWSRLSGADTLSGPSRSIRPSRPSLPINAGRAIR